MKRDFRAYDFALEPIPNGIKAVVERAWERRKQRIRGLTPDQEIVPVAVLYETLPGKDSEQAVDKSVPPICCTLILGSFRVRYVDSRISESRSSLKNCARRIV
jgi:hypothetical protein